MRRRSPRGGPAERSGPANLARPAVGPRDPERRAAEREHREREPPREERIAVRRPRIGPVRVGVDDGDRPVRHGPPPGRLPGRTRERPGQESGRVVGPLDEPRGSLVPGVPELGPREQADEAPADAGIEKRRFEGGPRLYQRAARRPGDGEDESENRSTHVAQGGARARARRGPVSDDPAGRFRGVSPTRPREGAARQRPFPARSRAFGGRARGASRLRGSRPRKGT